MDSVVSLHQGRKYKVATTLKVCTVWTQLCKVRTYIIKRHYKFRSDDYFRCE